MSRRFEIYTAIYAFQADLCPSLRRDHWPFDSLGRTLRCRPTAWVATMAIVRVAPRMTRPWLLAAVRCLAVAVVAGGTIYARSACFIVAVMHPSKRDAYPSA